MSTYTDKLTHPLTGKKQIAICHDDHFGKHKYGYGFNKDGSDVELMKFSIKDMDFFTFEELKSNK